MTSPSFDDHSDSSVQRVSGGRLTTVVLEVKGLHWASEKAVIEGSLRRLDGVRSVEANPVAQTAMVCYDPSATNVGELRRSIEECGYHCAGQSVPGHVRQPTSEPRTVGEAGLALPIAAGVFEPTFGLVLRPEIAVLSMSGSSFLVAVNALVLERLRLPSRVEVDDTDLGVAKVTRDARKDPADSSRATV